MATGLEWENYFLTKSRAYLMSQVKAINQATKNLDNKIIDAFQLTYLTMIKHIIQDILNHKYGAR
jgi:hypothetical protein